MAGLYEASGRHRGQRIPCWRTGRASSTPRCVDEQLAAWCQDRSGDDIVQTLWDAGVPVAKVMQPHRQTELDQLSFRGFFEVVDHPVNGKANFSTVAMRFSGGPERFTLNPRRCLGSTTTRCSPKWA